MGDILILPAIIFFERLSDYMLAINGQCLFKIVGGECVTCGGTHFVNAILNGKIIEAFNYNQFLFAVAVTAVTVWVLLHLVCFFSINWAKKALKKIFSLKSLLFWSLYVFAFLFLRNLDLLYSLIQNAFK